MNKQEVIQKINDSMFSSRTIPLTYQSECFNQGMDTALKIISKLDEPQKVKVPAYVAEKMKYYKSALGMLASEYFDSSSTIDSDELANWIEQNSDKFFRAWLDGYEVEEQLYIMPLPYVELSVHYCIDKNGKVVFRQGNAQKFTEAELDEYFPDIKRFAVKV